MPQPSTTEWVAAAVGAGLITLLGGLHLLRPALRPGSTPASRVAGLLLAMLAAGAVLLTAVLLGAAIRASRITIEDLQTGTHLPAGPFARYLINANPDTTERVGGYATALLLPLAGTLAVLALAAVDVGRSIGLRAVAALISGSLLLTSAFVVRGDAAALASGVAIAVALLSAGVAVAFGIDEVTHPRDRH